MSNYSTTANIVLSVNGRQAQQVLKNLQKEAVSLEKKLAAASVAGDKATMKKLQRELNNTKRTMDQLKGSSATCEQVLARLDRASPRELNKTLKTLQQQLNGIQRGTAAWDAHTAKIRAVKAELQRVNATMATQQSMWGRFNGWLNSTSTAIMGAVAAVSGIVMAGRSAVNAYASMEEQMANTRKFTRMTAAEVQQLNEAFLRMDTRVAREELNLLAQEGGRLGYNTLEKVQGYVEAAQIIKVALVDLGEGATQQIAKISNIFGQEQLYGVRDAMLKVGSTVNHLSQNCTASKPFIVEFAQRMAGVGSTARMTIPEIMAFAATLDAHGQKVEMSASALSRLVTQLFKNPVEIAKRTGMNVGYFLKVLRNDVTQGVMMFLEQLNKIGEKDALAALAPLFDDIDMNGIRMTQVLSNLSSHLDFLKWQMGEANQAFREGKSASNEYAIFNNTVQASIDKARARVHELAIELGEKLYPVMKHIYTSSGVFLRVLNAIATFIVTYKSEIAAAAVSLAAYNAVMLVYNARTMLAAKWTAMLNAAMNLVRNTGPIRLAIVALMNAYEYLRNGLEATYTMQMRWQAAMNAMKFTSWIGILAAVAGAFVYLYNNIDRYREKLREAAATASEFSDALTEEMERLDRLIGKLEGCTKETDEYKKVKEEIISGYGRYLNGLIDEKGEIVDLTKAYDRLAAAARLSARERAINKAREVADETYSERFKELAKRLEASLVKAGKDTREAARVSQRIITQLMTTGTITADLKRYLESMPGSLQQSWGWLDHPAYLTQRMIDATVLHGEAIDEIDAVEAETNPLGKYTAQQLQMFIDDVAPKVKAGKGGRIIMGIDRNAPQVRTLSHSELKDLLVEAEARLSVFKTRPKEERAPWGDYPYDQLNKDSGRGGGADKPDRFHKENNWRAVREMYALRDKVAGQRLGKDGKMHGYTAYDYDMDMTRIEAEYYAKLLERTDLEWLERRQLEVKHQEALAKLKEQYSERDLRREDETNARNKARITQQYADGYLTQEQYNQRIEDEDVRHLGRRAAIYRQLAFARQDEWRKARDKAKAEGREFTDPEPAFDAEAYARYVEADTLYKGRVGSVNAQREKNRTDFDRDWRRRYEEMHEEYFFVDERREQQYEADAAILEQIYDKELRLAADNADRKLQVEQAYQMARVALARKYGMEMQGGFEAQMMAFAKWLESDGGKAFTGAMGTVTQGMGSIFSEVSSLMQADLEIQTAAINKRYEAEITAAEGNSGRVRAIEKRRDAEIARAKNEMNRKMFAMQVIQAVAQTAQNAIAAYGSAAAIPVAGFVLAPIAAAMATAAGMLQVASIKKQQQAAEAQGYARGGFTRPGRVDEVAGVVHAGEWVASQRLVNNPRTRPILEALDYAQRNNAVASLRMEDVSRSITAPVELAAQRTQPQRIVVQSASDVHVAEAIKRTAEAIAPLSSTIARLNGRLSEPFVTVNTVTGDHGMQRAQEEYSRMMRNKSPKR